MFIALSLIFLTSFLLTGVVRRYALKNEIMDVPISRSSHSIATPVGGGLSIVITFAFSLLYLWAFKFLDLFFVSTLLASGFLVAGTGLLDDYYQIRIRFRLSIHIGVAIGVVYFLGPPFSVENSLALPVYQLWVMCGVSVFLIVWFLNLYNFMDGIDGLAANQAVFISLSGALLAWLGDQTNIVYSLLFLGTASFGFLVWNWPPAKIFMGDVGSGFLGITFAIISYKSVIDGISIWCWVILFGVFIVDTGLTLILRIAYKKKWYEAHCSHAYQHGARKWGHLSITLMVSVINYCWLLPMSALAFYFPQIDLYILIISFIPLLIIAWKLGAGSSVLSL